MSVVIGFTFKMTGNSVFKTNSQIFGCIQYETYYVKTKIIAHNRHNVSYRYILDLRQ